MQPPPEFYTPAEAAELLKVSVDTVIRKFERFPGVIDLGSPEARTKRRRRVLRIPREAMDRFILGNQVAPTSRLPARSPGSGAALSTENNGALSSSRFRGRVA